MKSEVALDSLRKFSAADFDFIPTFSLRFRFGIVTLKHRKNKKENEPHQQSQDKIVPCPPNADCWLSVNLSSTAGNIEERSGRLPLRGKPFVNTGVLFQTRHSICHYKDDSE